MVHITESTLGRRYAGWFIKNTERAQKILDDLKDMPLPQPVKQSSAVASSQHLQTPAETQNQNKHLRGKVAWGGVKVAS